jgi:hypothetical protein
MPRGSQKHNSYVHRLSRLLKESHHVFPEHYIGHGYVDLLAVDKRTGIRTAIEVETTPDNAISNMAKLSHTDFETIVVTCDSREVMEAIKRKAVTVYGAGVAERVVFILLKDLMVGLKRNQPVLDLVMVNFKPIA